MRNLFISIAETLHRLTVVMCMSLFGVMMVSTFSTVVLRYALSSGFLWLQDLSLFAFGLLAVLSLPIAAFHDRHVRVDIFRDRQNAAMRNRVDAFAVIFMLAPLFVLLLIYSFGDVIAAVRIGEGSQQIGGLPMYYLVKAGLPLSCGLMMVQAVARLFAQLQTVSER